MENEINTLAAQLNVTPSDVKGFLICLSGYIARGMTIEGAIAAHMRTAKAVFNSVATASKKQRVALVAALCKN